MAKQPNGAQRVITATELRRNFKAVVRQIGKRRESLAVFNEFARNLGKEVERRGLTEEELLADLEETKREVFEERYGRRK